MNQTYAEMMKNEKTCTTCGVQYCHDRKDDVVYCTEKRSLIVCGEKELVARVA